jgi:flagellar hook-associated protein 2
MQGFVDAYNTLVKAIDKLTAAGNADTKVSAGALNGDSGVRGLRNQLNGLLRTTVGGVSLTDYGISAQRDGTIALDADRFTKKLAANPDGLNTLLGQTNTLEYKRSGVMGALQTYINTWTNSTTGYLKNRQDGLQKQLAQYTKDQSTIDRLHDQAYQRYLTQFTALANLETTMGNTTGLLGSLFSSSSK